MILYDGLSECGAVKLHSVLSLSVAGSLLVLC